MILIDYSGKYIFRRYLYSFWGFLYNKSTVVQSHEKVAIGTRFEGPAIYRGFYAVDDAIFLNVFIV